MAENSKEPCWYVVHTYSGYENKVKDNIEKSVENNGMKDLIFDVRVPVEDVVEIKGNKRVKSQRKVYPGYVLVRMIETSESWYLVRNTRGVTGFVGPDSKPVPLTPEEQEELQKKEERKDRLHQNYLKRKASGAQKQYEDKIKAKKKAEMDAKKALIRAEDMKKGVFSTVGQLPKEEPHKGSIAASAAV